MKMRVSLVAVCAVLAGCNHLPGLLSEDSESREVVSLIAQANRFAGLQGEDQKKDMSAANQAFAKDRSAPSRLRLPEVPLLRLRLALFLSLPGTPFTDEARALTLLEPFVAAGAAAKNTPLRQFGGLLHVE